jgi:DnaJ-class molecular chaperone
MYSNNCTVCRHKWETEELVDECPNCEAKGSQFIGRKFIGNTSDQLPGTLCFTPGERAPDESTTGPTSEGEGIKINSEQNTGNVITPADVARAQDLMKTKSTLEPAQKVEVTSDPPKFGTKPKGFA